VDAFSSVLSQRALEDVITSAQGQCACQSSRYCSNRMFLAECSWKVHGLQICLYISNLLNTPWFLSSLAICLEFLQTLNTGGACTLFFQIIALASDESSEKNVPLWRKELTSLEDPAGENSALEDDFLQQSSLEEDIARLQKKRDLEKRMENFNRTGDASMGEETTGDGMAKTVIEKVLVADFFFILFILAWLVAGLGERSFLESTRLIDAWLPLWTTVFQPALGVFMAGAIVSAVSGFLSKSGNK
jgi:hypothetical protein